MFAHLFPVDFGEMKQCVLNSSVYQSCRVISCSFTAGIRLIYGHMEISKSAISRSYLLQRQFSSEQSKALSKGSSCEVLSLPGCPVFSLIPSPQWELHTWKQSGLRSNILMTKSTGKYAWKEISKAVSKCLFWVADFSV